MNACPETTLATLMAQSARATRSAMRRAGMTDGILPSATARKPPGRAPTSASVEAERMLREGRPTTEVHRETQLTMSQVRRLRRRIEEDAQ